MKESPMRAMFLIASKGRPEFKSWNTISARFSFQLKIILFLQIFFNIVHLNILAFRFRTFLGRALTFDPDQRATAEELLKDPFITRLDNMLKNKAIMMFFIFLSDLLIDNNPFLYFVTQYVLTRITYFGALALFTCYCLLCKTKWYKTEFHYHSSKCKWNSRQKDACENHWREKIEPLRGDSDPSHPSSSWPLLAE